MPEEEVVRKDQQLHKTLTSVYRWFLLILFGLLAIALSCSEISCFKIYFDNTKEEGAAFATLLYFFVHWVISKITWEIQSRRSHHLENYSEYLVPNEICISIAVIGGLYYVIICLMTPHIQSTHLVLLMQSSCVFSCIFLYIFKMIGWSVLPHLYYYCSFLLLSITISISLFLNRRTCCKTIVVATILFLVAVIINSFNISLTSKTLLQYPSMQSQFEMNVYKYQCYSWFFLIYILFCIRNPTHIRFVDLFTFLQEFGHGFMLTFVHTWNWLLFIIYFVSGILYDLVYSKLVVYSNPVYTSIIQVCSFLLSLTVMWKYEDIHETPTHDIFTIISFVLFSCLLFWEGISLPVFRTHRGSFFENRHEGTTTPLTTQEAPV